MALADNANIEVGQVYILRPLSNDTWIKLKKYDFCNDDIAPSPNKQGLPITGLTEDRYELNSSKQKIQVKGTRTLIEEKMGLDAGTLSRGSTIKPNPFWSGYSVRVNNSGDTKFDTNNPEEELAVRFLAAQYQVAFGIKNRTSMSEYVLFTREEENQEENKRLSLRRKAIVAFENLTVQEKYDIMELTGNKTQGLTESGVDAKLGLWAEDNAQMFLAIVNDPSRKQKVWVNQCTKAGVVRNEGGVLMFGETTLGVDVSAAAAFLFSEKGKPVREAMHAQVVALNSAK